MPHKLASLLTAIAFCLFTLPAFATMQEVGPQGWQWPQYPIGMGTVYDGLGTAGAVLSGSTQKVAYIGRYYANALTCRNGSATKNIQSIGFNVGGGGGASGTWTVQVDIESVSITANNPVQPTGTILGGGNAKATMASGTVTNAAWNTTPNLSSVATVHCGDLIAVVFSFSAYTSGQITITQPFGTDPEPWGATQSNFNGASWSTQGASAGGTFIPNIQFNNDDSTAGTLDGTTPLSQNNSNFVSVDTASTPREYGFQFSAPFDGQLSGLCFSDGYTDSSTTATIKLTDTAGTPNVLALINTLGHQAQSTGTFSALNCYPILVGGSPSRVTVTRNVNYVVGLAGTSASPHDANMTFLKLPSASSSTVFFSCATACGQVQRNSSSAAWGSFTNTTIPYAAVIYAAIDDNTGP